MEEEMQNNERTNTEARAKLAVLFKVKKKKNRYYNIPNSYYLGNRNVFARTRVRKATSRDYESMRRYQEKNKRGAEVDS